MNIIFNCLNLFAWIPVQIFIFSLTCLELINMYEYLNLKDIMVITIAIGSISILFAIVYSAMNLAFHYPAKPDNV